MKRNGLGKDEIRDLQKEMAIALQRLKRNRRMLVFFGTFLPYSGERAEEKRIKIAYRMGEAEIQMVAQSAKNMLLDLWEVNGMDPLIAKEDDE